MDMIARESRTAIETAAARLRTLVLERDEGALIGNEDALIAQLGCSRATVRQVARLLEREGLLKVKRGITGGYFGARPDAGSIEATVAAYLELIEIDVRDVTVLASALWVETMSKAAFRARAGTANVAALRERVTSIPDDASFNVVRTLELETQEAIFRLANSSYIKLIFDINMAFSRRRMAEPLIGDQSPEHREFVRKWRDAKLMELHAIASGDTQLAALAGRYTRRLWGRRLKTTFDAMNEVAVRGSRPAERSPN
ncbi:MAG: GntR family transcriptional regulator [Novosphingobium sp.]|nr:GntR family transcriptional regulator [Novosphingobium sp.]